MTSLAFHLDSAAGLCDRLALSALDALDLHDYCRAEAG
jgi:hypothetical protein